MGTKLTLYEKVGIDGIGSHSTVHCTLSSAFWCFSAAIPCLLNCIFVNDHVSLHFFYLVMMMMMMMMMMCAYARMRSLLCESVLSRWVIQILIK